MKISPFFDLVVGAVVAILSYWAFKATDNVWFPVAIIVASVVIFVLVGLRRKS